MYLSAPAGVAWTDADLTQAFADMAHHASQPASVWAWWNGQSPKVLGWTTVPKIRQAIADHCASCKAGSPHTGACDGGPIICDPAPLVTASPLPVTPTGQQDLPGTGTTAPATATLDCEPPSVPVNLDERWMLVEVDPSGSGNCRWQKIRNGVPLPQVYQGQTSILIPQSAPNYQTPLTPDESGLYTPGQVAASSELTAADITQAFMDVLGRAPDATEMSAAQAQGFTSETDLYAYVHSVATGAIVPGAAIGGGAATWVTDHPYLTLGAAAAAWLLFKKK